MVDSWTISRGVPTPAAEKEVTSYYNVVHVPHRSNATAFSEARMHGRESKEMVDLVRLLIGVQQLPFQHPHVGMT